jgi:hypothetical protein
MVIVFTPAADSNAVSVVPAGHPLGLPMPVNPEELVLNTTPDPRSVKLVPRLPAVKSMFESVSPLLAVLKHVVVVHSVSVLAEAGMAHPARTRAEIKNLWANRALLKMARTNM